MKRLLIYMVCSVLFSGCSPEDRALPPAPDAIRFVSGISVEVSKATGPVSGTVLQSGSCIGLFAASGGSGGGGGTVVMNNLMGTVEAEGAIDYDPVKYYEKDKEYNFYACYPYTVSDYTDAGKAPLLSVSLAPNAQAQDDYLVGFPAGYNTGEGKCDRCPEVYLPSCLMSGTCTNLER